MGPMTSRQTQTLGPLSRESEAAWTPTLRDRGRTRNWLTSGAVPLRHITARSRQPEAEQTAKLPLGSVDNSRARAASRQAPCSCARGAGWLAGWVRPGRLPQAHELLRRPACATGRKTLKVGPTSSSDTSASAKCPLQLLDAISAVHLESQAPSGRCHRKADSNWASCSPDVVPG
jgi:hypothetical protein